MNFILLHFDEVSRTAAFEEMGRTNVELSKYFTTSCSACIVELMVLLPHEQYLRYFAVDKRAGNRL